jgi:GH35 family endo-1,4-beta-xylanase
MVAIAALSATEPPGARAQAGFPDSLRRYSDDHTVPFRIGTAVTLRGGPSLYPPNGYQPGLLTDDPRDRAYQALVRGQFNQIEAGNETKMMSLWTGGAGRVNGHYVAKTNLFDAGGPLSRLCEWAGAQRPRLTVRGHCMVYYQGYTVPTFPAGQPPLFVQDAGGRRVLNSPYTPEDLRDMLRSYVQQVVDATMAQNAASRGRHSTRVIEAWDVTNEVVSEDAKDSLLPQQGFAYRGNDPWYNNGPRGADGSPGYDYVGDIYRWAAQQMSDDVGRTIAGRRISAADGFSLYYNDYNLEWSAPKMAHVLALVKHVRDQGGTVDGLGFQAHVEADGLDTKQFGKGIDAAVAAQLRFSVTEADCAISRAPGKPDGPQQEADQGREYAQIVALCMSHRKSCDAFQVWGATDDGAWIQNAEATPVTRWVRDTRPGATKGQAGYWPKVGQFAPATLYDPATGALDPHSGHDVSDAYDQILTALKSRQKKKT